MTTTIVKWALGTPSSEIMTIIDNKADEMQLAGKTDNNPIKEEGLTEQTVSRTWTTIADAEEWIVFVEQYGPDSATIQS